MPLYHAVTHAAILGLLTGVRLIGSFRLNSCVFLYGLCGVLDLCTRCMLHVQMSMMKSMEMMIPLRAGVHTGDVSRSPAVARG